MDQNENRDADLVEVRDDMALALERAREHAIKFYSAGRNTLIDQVSQADWDAWDASDERVLVSDPDGIELLEEPCHDEAA